MPEKMRGIGQGPLQGPVLLLEGGAELSGIGIQRFDPAPIELGHALESAAQPDPGPFVGALLGEDQGARVEVDGGQADLLRDRLSRRLPAETARHHQMDDEIEIVLHSEDDSFSDTLQRLHLEPHRGVVRRVVGAQHRRRGDPHPAHHLTEDAPLQCLQIDHDVGKLRHEAEATGRSRLLGLPERSRGDDSDPDHDSPGDEAIGEQMVGIGCGAASGEPEHDHESRYGDDGRHPGPFRPSGDGEGGAHHEEAAEDEREPEVASRLNPWPAADSAAASVGSSRRSTPPARAITPPSANAIAPRLDLITTGSGSALDGTS